MRLATRSICAIFAASVLGLMTGCGEVSSEGMEIEPEVTSEAESAYVGINGYFEKVQGGTAYGWFCVPSAPSVPIYVYVYYISGSAYVPVGQGYATTYRADLAARCGGSAAHALNLSISTNAYGLYYWDTGSLETVNGEPIARYDGYLTTGGN